jgi:hypothetical protein
MKRGLFFHLEFPLFLDFILINFDESPKGAVVCFFYTVGEETGWKFSHPPVVRETFTADALTAARLPCAVAFLEVLFFLAFLHC